MFHSKFMPHVRTLKWGKNGVNSLKETGMHAGYLCSSVPVSNVKFFETTCSRNQFSEIKVIQERPILPRFTTAKISEKLREILKGCE
jgi:hypothetical protein